MEIIERLSGFKNHFSFIYDKFVSLSTTHKTIIIYLLISAITIFAYYPTFFTTFRADQWCYWADTNNCNSWFDLVTKFYSYNRVRVYNSGDVFLFRPILFILLGTEKFFFGYHQIYWQITGVVLYLVFAWILLVFLLKIDKSILSFMLCTFFVFLSTNFEMVTWQHINGYILFMIFMASSLYLSYRYVQEKLRSKSVILAIFLFNLLAIFTHELGVIFSFLIFIYLLIDNIKRNKSSKSFSFYLVSIPIPLYILVNFLDFNYYSAGGAKGFISLYSGYIYKIFECTVSLLYTISLWICAAILPFTQRSHIGSRFVFDIHHHFEIIFVVVIILSLILLLIIKKIKFNLPALKNYNHLSFVCLNVIMLLSVALIIALRMIVNGPSYVNISIYYSYMFWFFAIVTICYLKKINFLEIKSNYKKIINRIIFLALSLIIILNIINLHLFSSRLSRHYKQYYDQYYTIGKIIDRHKNSEDFSFSFLNYGNNPEINQWLNNVKRKMGKNEKYSLSLLFNQYINDKNPKYYISFDENNHINFVRADAKQKKANASK
ncbi:MAG: hypothetical protein GY750_16870 [Lentisphaerae bacterium]|nr:hypothetical protein [Lentisphaerota bacterium]MCP4103070.1 hypothetical protein [Lentisphaerota bacterium]